MNYRFHDNISTFKLQMMEIIRSYMGGLIEGYVESYCLVLELTSKQPLRAPFEKPQELLRQKVCFGMAPIGDDEYSSLGEVSDMHSSVIFGYTTQVKSGLGGQHLQKYPQVER